MATEPAICNVTTDLRDVAPDIETFDGKRTLRGWTNTGTIYYTLSDCGYTEQLFFNGADLGAPEASAVAVDGDTKWFYDSTLDMLTIGSASNPDTATRVEGGPDWPALKARAVALATETFQSAINKPLVPRPSASQGISGRDYDAFVIDAVARLACSHLIKPYDEARASMLYAEVMGGVDMVGMAHRIKSGEVALWNEVSRRTNEGVPRAVALDATTTGALADLRGEATTSFDLIKVVIAKSGTITEGVASEITYSTLVGGPTGLKTVAGVTAATITGGYQYLAHGIYGRFTAGVYVLDDEWEVEVRGGKPEAGSKDLSIPLRRLG